MTVRKLKKSYNFAATPSCLLAGAALPENNEASAELTTANGGTITASSARLSSQSPLTLQIARSVIDVL